MPAATAAARARQLNPTVLEGNFSDNESGRRLRSSCRKGRNDEPDEPPTMEVVEEPGPSSSTSRETGTEAAGDLPTSVPEPAEAKRPPISNANVFEKVEINFIKAKDTANLNSADPFTDVLPNPSGGSTVSPNPSGGDTLFGHSKDDTGAYKAVKALRRSTNHVLGVGGGEGQQMSLHLWVPFLRVKTVRNLPIVT
jgi:hypothetical protein